MASSFKMDPSIVKELHPVRWRRIKHAWTRSIEHYGSRRSGNLARPQKPSGISVQRGTKSKRNIIDILKKTNEFKETSPYPVHRIDKETTGVLIVAKNRKYAQILTSLF